MTFKLSTRSKNNLKGVHPRLVEMVHEAITLTPVDFGILDDGGLRTAAMQQRLYRAGASKLDGRSRKSKHQKQPSGYGEAVDLVPYFNGMYRWEWPLIYPIASTMAFLSHKHGVELRWGGVWDRELDDYAPKKAECIDDYAPHLKRAVREYCVRHPGPDFIDGPHYEMLR